MPGVVAATEPSGAKPFEREVLLDLDSALLPADQLAGTFASAQAALWVVGAVRIDSLARDLQRDVSLAPAPAMLSVASTETAFARLATDDPATRARVLLASALAAVGTATERRGVAWDPRLQEIADLGAALAALWQQRGVTLPALSPAVAAVEVDRARHTAPSAEQAAASNDARALAVEDTVVRLRERAIWLRAAVSAEAVRQHAAAQLSRLGDAPMAARYRATFELAAAVQAAVAAIRR